MRNVYLWLFTSIFLGAFGQCLLKLSVRKTGSIDLSWTNILPAITKIFTNWWVISGVILFAFSMVLWLKVISEMELSKAYPTVSLTYLIVFFFSVLFLGEKISAWKLAGMAFIITGIFFIHH